MSADPRTHVARQLDVVVAPDSFKGTFGAGDAADAMRTGWLSRRPHDRVAVVPQADGGEGTIDVIAAVRPDAVINVVHGITGPDGRPVSARWLMLPDGTAVVELAESSGIALMAAPGPGVATTRGLGEMIAVAVRGGARRVVVGLGGSASTDGGAGALAALGVRLLDASGHELPDGGDALAQLASVDTSSVLAMPDDGVELLCDTSAPLVGPQGAAQVFGPQKGADPTDVRRLDDALHHWADVLSATGLMDGAAVGPDAPGAGAAGGTGFGLAAWGGCLVPGAARIADITGIDTALGSADVLVTGEGQYDSTSTTGKLVGDLVARARTCGVRVVVVAGRVVAAPGGDTISFDLTELAGSTEESMADPGRWLVEAGALAATQVGTAD